MKQSVQTPAKITVQRIFAKALITVLGSHVKQAGSFVNEDRLRFDFTHYQAMTAEEIAKVEQMVMDQIANNILVETQNMSIEEAKKTGAMALFGEKYGEVVRVVKMGDFSTELCGGTHVSNTGAIMAFKILSESSVSANVRRIEALTGNGVFRYYKDLEQTIEKKCENRKINDSRTNRKIRALNGRTKSTAK